MGAVVGTVGAGGAVVGGGAVVVGTALVAAAVVVVASALTLDVSLATLPGEHPEANSPSTRAAHTTATRFLANAIRNSSPVKSVRIILSEHDPHVAAGLASGGVARWAVYDPLPETSRERTPMRNGLWVPEIVSWLVRPSVGTR